MGRQSILAAAGWLATAAVATLIGVGAIRLVGESITGTPGGVRSQGEISRALAAPEPTDPGAATGPAVTATPDPGTTPAPTGAPASPGVRRGFATTGGTAVAECGPAGVRLVSWAPAQGYRVRDVDRGPDEHVEVRFIGAAGEGELKLRCVAGQPVAEPRK
jgi:hypothetical protein